MDERLAGLVAPYRGEKGALIPVLQKVQGELGYISEDAVSQVARFLGLSPSEVFGVATFYAQFRFHPIGKNLVRVCRGTACHVKGGAHIQVAVENQLGVKAGETTADLEYTLETVACLGCCALAPAMTINDDVHGQMTTKKVASIFTNKAGVD